MTRMMKEKIKNLIESSDMSRYRIAQESGVSEGNLSRFVHGTAGLSIESAERICEALGYRIEITKIKRTKR